MITYSEFVKKLDLDSKTMSNIDISEIVEKIGIKNFRGVMMKDELVENKVKRSECGVINLEDSDEVGSHWTCYFKKGKSKYYFDSYGLDPPNEMIEYLISPIRSSTFKIQR